MKEKWIFDKVNNPTTQGLNDAGIATFQDDVFKSLTKEICQNSLDAVDDINKAVEIEFQSFILGREKFPDRDGLVKVIDYQIDFWDKIQKHDKSPVIFYKKAKRSLTESKITFLRISDKNTKGLTDSDKNYGGNWNNLVKSNSVSDKVGSAGGSFGIGKSAAYSVSKIRTIFYSTLDIKNLEAFQGVAKFTTFIDEKGVSYAPTGYYLLEDSSHVTECISLDAKYKRIVPGTDIFISNFRKDSKGKWHEMILISVLNSFLLSLFNKKIKVTVNKVDIHANNFRTLFNKYLGNDYLEDFTKDYYRVLNKVKTQKFYFSMFEKDDIELSLLFDKDLGRRVGIFRQNGMKIFDKGNYSRAESFAGVCYLKGDAVNEFFKKLENPAHDKWRFDGEDAPEDAKKQRDRLYGFLSDTINEIIDKKSKEEIDVEGLNEFIPDFIEDENVDNNKNSETETINDDIELSLEVKKKQKSPDKIRLPFPNGGSGKSTSENGFEDPNGDDETSTPGDGSGGKGGNKGSDDGISATKGEGNLRILRSTLITPVFLKIISVNDYNELVLKVDKNYNKLEINLRLSGEQRKFKYNLKEISSQTTDYKVINGKLILDNVKKDINHIIKFNKIGKNSFALEVEIYDIQFK